MMGEIAVCPPSDSVPMSTLSPLATITLGRPATAAFAAATGPAATVKNCPAGTPESVNRPVSSVRALIDVFWAATSTAPAGRPNVGTGTGRPGCGGTSGAAGCVCDPASGAMGSGTPRRHDPQTTRPVTVPGAGCAATPWLMNMALIAMASAAITGIPAARGASVSQTGMVGT